MQRIPVLCDELTAKGDQYVAVKLHVYEGIPATNRQAGLLQQQQCLGTGQPVNVSIPCHLQRVSNRPTGRLLTVWTYVGLQNALCNRLEQPSVF